MFEYRPTRSDASSFLQAFNSPRFLLVGTALNDGEGLPDGYLDASECRHSAPGSDALPAGSYRFYSYRASRTLFLPYQFRPVIKMLRTGSRRLLIADEVGDYYVERVYKLTLGTYLGRGSKWQPSKYPEQIRPWVERIKGCDTLTLAEKREALVAWYTEMGRGADSGLPKNFQDSFRKSKAGFTEDVMDRSLLEGPPRGSADQGPSSDSGVMMRARQRRARCFEMRLRSSTGSA